MVCSTLFTCLILVSESIKCMLNFNSPPSTTDVPQWKVLIYDQFGRDIISPLLTVKELRALGVTLHLLLDSSRENIPDVPAIYFVYPSEENIFRICKDFEADRYESYYLNFISPISRELLESVAQTALSEDCVQRITKVFDQYTNFICIEDDLVVLRPPASQSPSYYGKSSCMCTGDASEMVATRLEAKLRDSLRDSRNSLFLTSEAGRTAVGTAPMPSARDTSVIGEHRSGGPSFPTLFQRPLLVLLDRNLDLATPLHHEMSYQSLVHDIFNIRLNRVQVDLEFAKDVPSNEGTNKSEDVRKKPTKLEQYDLSTSTDRLWREFKGAAFSDVAEAIREEVTTLRTYEKRMGELRSAMGLSAETGPAADSTLTLLDDNTARLTSAIRSDSNLSELIKSASSGIPEDKLRLLLFAALLRANNPLASGGSGTSVGGSGGSSGSGSGAVEFCLSDNEVNQLKSQLKDTCPELDLSAVDYVQHLRRLSRMGHLADSTALKSSSSRSMLNKLVSHGSAIFFTGMRHLIGRKSYLPFTRIVSQLMENKSGAEVEEYRYFDPKLYRRQNVDMPRFKQPFYEAFVFVIGGGSYVEYQNLIDWTRESAGGSVAVGSSNNLVGTVGSTNNTTTNGSLGPGSNDASGSASSASLSSSAPSASARRITYGCTEVVSPTEFLDQLTKLGHEL
ncbi:Sec1 family domain-containing protein 1 isoform a [Fasciola gigantica]|uniref:Sec1 family domain-containing protein 1 isoform a n=1 Tax=Fasciola gigantica TaxID=46835 RepID=A0A504Z9Z2_FASGI|nr:Sec1 family domain-containing protein 1 isoform a [Fasciola gigantica]